MKYLLGILALGPAMAWAGETSAPWKSFERPSAWEFSLDAGYIHQENTDIDGAGEFSVDRFHFGVGAKRDLGRGSSVGLSLDYGNHRYDFSDVGPEPWDEVHAFTLAAPIRYTFGPKWQLFALPSVSAKFEDGADVSDSITAGLLTGVSYKVSDRLYIGPGFGVSSELEDSVNVFPVLLINWQISESLQLRTGSGLGASQGPGLVLNWQAAEKWKLSLGSRYERLRFRLSDNGSVPDGVGEESGVPVYLAATYAFCKNSEITLYGGLKFGGSLEVDNDSGDEIVDVDYDTAAFFGVSFSAKF